MYKLNLQILIKIKLYFKIFIILLKKQFKCVIFFQFPLFNSYVPGYAGLASPNYVLSSHSLGGFKYQSDQPSKFDQKEKPNFNNKKQESNKKQKRFKFEDNKQKRPNLDSR